MQYTTKKVFDYHELLAELEERFPDISPMESVLFNAPRYRDYIDVIFVDTIKSQEIRDELIMLTGEDEEIYVEG